MAANLIMTLASMALICPSLVTSIPVIDSKYPILADTDLHYVPEKMLNQNWPSVDELEPHRYMENASLFGGDIVVSNSTDSEGVGQYNAGNAGSRWEKIEVADYSGSVKMLHAVPFVIHPSISENSRQRILQVMRTKFLDTCIRFVHYERKSPVQTGHIMIFAGQGCYAQVGKMGGQQIVSLADPHCMYEGIIAHELMHAMGFWHMHQRPDRDQFIQIYHENIDPSQMQNFNKAQYGSDVSNLYKWDNEGIMLYGSRSFQRTPSNDPSTWTMATRDGQRLREVHEKYGLSQADISAVNQYYGCCDQFQC